MLPSTTMLLVFLLLLLVASPTVSFSRTSGPHIADVNILLPPKMTHPVEYRLQGTDGCFNWSWDHHDILALFPEYNSSSHCSTSARIKSIAPYSGRKETAIYATDVNTGMVIRCKVYIDIFSRIQIFHNSIKLDLDGLATLRVRAFDSEENVFSSLVGLQFMWHLMPETNGLPHHLDHVPLKDSPLSDCGGLCGDLDIQVKLEDSGAFSDLFVVKGIEIGHENVSVNLIEPSFEHMRDKIILTVAEAMSLDPPSPVFILIGGVVRYSLKVIRGNIPQVVPLPSPFHLWSIVNSSVAQVDRTMGETYALNLGVTTVVVEDSRVSGHTQMSSLHVVLPGNLLLYILPLSPSGSPIEGIKPVPSVARWYVISGRQYLVHLKVFSQGPGSQEICITESDDIKLYDDQSGFWNMLPVSDNIAVKDSKLLEAIGLGLGKLIASLTYSSGLDETEEVMKVAHEVMVCDPVKFSMSKGTSDHHRILLPWAPGINQDLELKVTGGCAIASSEYRWFSSDVDIVSVSASGIALSKNPGKSTIKVVSMYDSCNYDEVEIEVSVPSSMVILQTFPVEVFIGSHLQASLTLKAPDGAYYDKCDAFSSFVKWRTESESFTINNTAGESLFLDERGKPGLKRMSSGTPCAWTVVYASNPGRTMLHARLTKEYLQLDHSISGIIVLKASQEIAAYTPLIVHEVSDGSQFGGYSFNFVEAEAHNQLENLECLNLVPGTRFDVMLRGGPERWGKGVEFIETLEILDEKHSKPKDGVLVRQVFADYGTLYRIMCERKGAFELVFKRGNLIGDNHLLPAVAEVKLLLMCHFPSSIALIADEPVNSLDAIHATIQADRTKENVRVTLITVENGRRIRLSAVGISKMGKAFGNSSSLLLYWELSNCGQLAVWDDVYNSANTKSSWEKFLILQNTSGLCIVRATVGYDNNMGNRHDKTPFESSGNSVTDAVSLQIVSSLRVNPEFGLLFFSNDARMNLSITGGSCFLDTQVNDSRILEVIQLPVDLQCLQLMLAPKGLGTALVKVYDIGLTPPLAASSVVQVSDVDWIKITTEEEVSLMKGNLLSISFLAGNDDGHVFDSSQYVYMNINIHIEDHIVELVDSFPSSSDGYLIAPNLTIRGSHLGVTTLYLSARHHSGDKVLSQTIKVEVYAPPRIHPSDIFLVPGASYVLSVRGGPTFGAYVEYSSMNDETSIVHKSLGRLSAISPGNTTLVATFYGNGGILICQAYGKVKVAVPSSAVLTVQSEHLAIGHKMPISPSLSEGNLFSFYELCSNYKWIIEDEDILGFHVAERLQGVSHGISSPTANRYINYLDEEDLGFLKVLQGRSPGKTNVTVSFSCEFGSSNSFSQSRLYSAFISLWVVSDLPLSLGSHITWILPPHYVSSDLLPLSSNSFGKGDSISRKGTIAYSLLGECGGRAGKLQNDVILVDGGKIKTNEADSLACIQAKDRSTGRTEVACCVRVAEVSQARITQDVLVVRLAVGAELDLPIKYYDILGHPFHEAYNVSLFEAETNYPDIVTIETSYNNDGRIYLRAASHGNALVQIAFTKNPQKLDYLMIFVGAQLHPLNPVLSSGSRLNFSIEGLKDQALGHWFSANSSIIYVDMLTGEAEAVGEGSTQVYYEGANLKLQTKVTVSKGNLVTVDAPKETLTNAPPFPDKGYLFPVKLIDAYDHKYLFDCTVEPPYVGFAEPWLDLDTGKPFCIFFPNSPEHLVRSVSNYGNMRREIPISIKASLQGENSSTGSASALFIGGFSLLEFNEESVQLNLTPRANRTLITIMGNTDVEIHWHNRDQLSVRAIHREDSTRRGHALYEIEVLRDERFKDKVMITLPATGQRTELHIRYEPERTDDGRANIDTRTAFVFVIISVFIVVSTLLYWLQRSGQLEQPLGPSNNSQVVPTTPLQSSRPVLNEQSPRTPQPFIDYVRRTIDETPYYRQDFRRRMNPQNTY